MSLTQTYTKTHIFVHMLGLTVNRLLSWPFCLPFFSFLALPVCGVEVGALVFLAERGAWTSATGLTSSCSASCTTWGFAGANEEQEGRRYTKQKDKEKGSNEWEERKLAKTRPSQSRFTALALYEKIQSSHVKQVRTQNKTSRCLHPLLDAILIEGDRAAVRATVKSKLSSPIHFVLQFASLKAIVCSRIWNSVFFNYFQTHMLLYLPWLTKREFWRIFTKRL